MTLTFAPAERKNVSLLISLAGASGSGKTFSALELATGLSPAGRIAFIDTEARRGLHYADMFNFQHADMQSPFRPDAFIQGIRAAEQTGAEVLLIDSMSHEYDGEGGIMDWAAELERGQDGQGGIKSPGNWKAPKLAHKKMMNQLLEARCHIIFCLRAEEKIAIRKKGDLLSDKVTVADRTVIEQMGWKPICEKRFPFEMTLSFTLRPDDPGKPQFDLPHKLQDQHRAFFPAGEFISREAGSRLADWAAGAPPPAADPIVVYGREVRSRIKQARDPDTLLTWWKSTMSQRTELEIPSERLTAMQQAVTERVEQLKANPGQEENTQ